MNQISVASKPNKYTWLESHSTSGMIWQVIFMLLMYLLNAAVAAAFIAFIIFGFILPLFIFVAIPMVAPLVIPLAILLITTTFIPFKVFRHWSIAVLLIASYIIPILYGYFVIYKLNTNENEWLLYVPLIFIAETTIQLVYWLGRRVRTRKKKTTVYCPDLIKTVETT